MSALSISLSGLQAAGQRFEASARRIVAAGAEAGNALVAATGNGDQGPATATGSGRIGFAPDMAGAMVDMMQAETAFKANARVAGRIQDMQQAYLDMLAEKPSR
jgi:flagellar basal body rod protein FlgC